VTTTAERAGRFPGWRVVTGCFIVLAVTSGLGFYGLAVYLNAFSRERGWNVAAISAATTLFFLVGGAVGVLVARLIARYDVRWVIVGGGVLGGVSLAALGQVQSVWQLYLAYSVFAVGFAAAGLVPVTTVVTRWFHLRRSVALSVASTGLSLGGVVITPAMKWMLDEYGLRAGTPWLGLLWAVVVIPVTLFMILPDPQSVGWEPDGVRSRPGVVSPSAAGMVFSQAVRHRFFVAVTIGYVFALGSQVGGIQQLVRLAETRTDQRTAAFATLFLAGTSVVARLVGGRLVMVMPMMAFTLGVVGVQVVALVMLAVAGSVWTLIIAIILFGSSIGNILMLQPLLIAERFGVRDYPRLFSRSQFVGTIGVAGGPLLLGWLHDVAGGYRVSYLVAAACSLVGLVILGLGGPATVSDP
jgi:MFS family permease